jgi:hypothetical protein
MGGGKDMMGLNMQMIWIGVMGMIGLEGTSGSESKERLIEMGEGVGKKMMELGVILTYIYCLRLYKMIGEGVVKGPRVNYLNKDQQS